MALFKNTIGIVWRLKIRSFRSIFVPQQQLIILESSFRWFGLYKSTSMKLYFSLVIFDFTQKSVWKVLRDFGPHIKQCFLETRFGVIQVILSNVHKVWSFFEPHLKYSIVDFLDLYIAKLVFGRFGVFSDPQPIPYINTKPKSIL